MTFRDSKSDVNAVDFMEGANAFVTGSDDGTCHLYDIRTYKVMGSYPIDTSVTSVAFSKSGRFFFAGDEIFCFGVFCTYFDHILLFSEKQIR